MTRIDAMSTRHRTSRKPSARRPNRRGFTPALEAFERRTLLTTGVLIQGTSFVDANTNNTLDPGENYLPGATLKLYDATGTTLLGQATTDAHGGYLFSDTSGTVFNNNLAPGTYRLVELPPSTGPVYQSSGVQPLWQLGPVPVVGTSGGIPYAQVTTLDPSKLFLEYLNANPSLRLGFKIKNDPFAAPGATSESFLGTMNLTAGTTLNPGSQPGATDLSTAFKSYCVDLNSDVTDHSKFQVLPRPSSDLPSGINLPPNTPSNGDRIAYLYNHYGTTALSQTDAAALQAAIHELEYDAIADSNPTTFNYTAALVDNSSNPAASGNFRLVSPPPRS
jgi:hypothetical protein